MMHMQNKKIVIGILLIILFIMPLIILHNAEINSNTNNLKNSKSQFAIMFKDNNTDTYEEFSGSIFDALNLGYTLNILKSTCTDLNNELLNTQEIISTDGEGVTITSNKTVNCTLYFDNAPIFRVQDILDNKPVGLSSTLVGGMYRFQGINEEYSDSVENPNNYPIMNNNYLCFGTNSKHKCLNNPDLYMYRIIGITDDGTLKVIKNTMIGYYAWEYSTNTWLNSPLRGGLNYSYGNYFITNVENYPYFKENKWQDIILTSKWKYGTILSLEGNGETIYEIEQGWEDFVENKVGLMYLSDYYLAYDNERDWKKTYDFSNWLYNGDMAWLLDHGEVVPYYIVKYSGSVNAFSGYLGYREQIRPVFYIDSSINLSGVGLVNDPYIIR